MMWKVIIQCSAEGWRSQATKFKELVANYSATPLSSKKMKEDDRRIMEYQLDDVNEAETLVEQCFTLDGFTAMFESM